MIKRTLFFGNPAILSKREDQLIIKLPEVEKNADLPNSFKLGAINSIPIEDIGLIILDHQQITITQALIVALIENNAAILFCNNKHLPEGLVLPMSANHTYSQKVKAQLMASEPLKKQLWKQTIISKIRNQAAVLSYFKKDNSLLEALAKKVNSGDSENIEARASAYYWKVIFDEVPDFTRNRDGVPPNNLLNYGYSIIRAIVARSLVGSGMLPVLGIHHRNKYNAYCLADDIMEPFRPYVDKMVRDMLIENDFDIPVNLTKDLKAQLLGLPVIDVIIEDKTSPLMVGMQKTTASLMRCFEGESRKILYPDL